MIYEAWCVGAKEPVGRTKNRNLARTAMLAVVGEMCQGGWRYSSSNFSGSGHLPDVVELAKGDERARFEVRPIEEEK